MEPSEKNSIGVINVIPADLTEDAYLEKLGYQQELKRSFSLLGMIGFSFSIVTSWTALAGVLIAGISAGGPPVMIYSWIAISILTLAVAYSMAEICSSYPVAGGQYSWVYILAPPKIARGASWVTGWLMITGILAMGATNNFVCSNFILGQVNLTHPDFVIERWHIVLVSYAVAFFAAFVNIWGPHLLEKISKASDSAAIIWNITSFFIVVIVVLATNSNKQPASFVFKEFQNFTGFGPAMAAILGILQSAFGMCCYDAPAHMTEEMKNASREAPKAIIMSVYIGAVTGFIFLISICFCIGNIDATASTPTGVPLIQIFFDSTQSTVGSCFLATLITIIGLFCAAALQAEGSRSLYAFARDHGLPFSPFWSKVDPKSKIPFNALLLAVAVQLALCAIDFGTTTGFNTVIAIGTEGFYLSYAAPLGARALSKLTGHHRRLEGAYTLGKFSLLLNVIGLLFLLFASITFNFPQVNPVTKDNMNYTSAALGAIGAISLLTWITTGRKKFTGPALGNAVCDESGPSESVEKVSNNSDVDPDVR
ncbi:amino acid transporter [Fomitiporia mediterranea MF3/22]|uniref:amino acid transporter n=1 Tax=Fomitiporia mediterranea (strain MF3/22) TaxID=694068 RepID=UPI0004409763|nr:amino acid transporter [Fomitiporia mediterranea MF3/22]EJD04196.1 amino acid transporter [Fomitiporia mediterranea MF3/22]